MKNLRMISINIIAIYTLCVSCCAYKGVLIHNAQQLDQVWKNKIQPMDQTSIKELVKKKNALYASINCFNDSAFYYSDNNKLVASISYYKLERKQSFDDRFNEMKTTFNFGELGTKLISSDCKKSGNDGVFAIEYINTNIQGHDEVKCFHVEAHYNGQFVSANIIADPTHMEKAIELIDSFTQSLSNTKLHL